jgi:AbiJ N-terminal domain 3
VESPCAAGDRQLAERAGLYHSWGRVRSDTSLWVLDDELGGNHTSSLHAAIQRHVYDNLGDWTPEYLFERLGAYECSHRRFCLFLGACFV